MINRIYNYNVTQLKIIHLYPALYVTYLHLKTGHSYKQQIKYYLHIEYLSS